MSPRSAGAALSAAWLCVCMCGCRDPVASERSRDVVAVPNPGARVGSDADSTPGSEPRPETTSDTISDRGSDPGDDAADLPSVAEVVDTGDTLDHSEEEEDVDTPPEPGDEDTGTPPDPGDEGGRDPGRTDVPELCEVCSAHEDCDDADLCTIDTCNPLTCECVYFPKDCDDRLECTVDFCRPTLGCIYEAEEGCCDFDYECNEGDLCTISRCDENHECQLVSVVDCDDGDPCTGDACDEDSGKCEHEPRDCDDGNICTSDGCDRQAGACFHIQTLCTDAAPCIDGICDPATGECSFLPRDCDDDYECNEGDLCMFWRCDE